jgi:hypothetical protein
MARAIHSSSGAQQQPATDALRQFLRSKSVVLASGLQRRRSSLEGRLANLSQEMSRISGYQSIEGLKQQVEEHGPSAATFRVRAQARATAEKMLADARKSSVDAKQAYTLAVQARAASQVSIEVFLIA